MATVGVHSGSVVRDWESAQTCNPGSCKGFVPEHYLQAMLNYHDQDRKIIKDKHYDAKVILREALLHHRDLKIAPILDRNTFCERLGRYLSEHGWIFHKDETTGAAGLIKGTGPVEKDDIAIFQTTTARPKVLPGVFQRSDSIQAKNPSEPPVATVDIAYNSMRESITFSKSVDNIDLVKAHNGIVLGTVNYGGKRGYPNAFWNDDQMVEGAKAEGSGLNDLGKARSVTWHEMGHARNQEVTGIAVNSNRQPNPLNYENTKKDEKGKASNGSGGYEEAMADLNALRIGWWLAENSKTVHDWSAFIQNPENWKIGGYTGSMDDNDDTGKPRQVIDLGKNKSAPLRRWDNPGSAYNSKYAGKDPQVKDYPSIDGKNNDPHITSGPWQYAINQSVITHLNKHPIDDLTPTLSNNPIVKVWKDVLPNLTPDVSYFQIAGEVVKLAKAIPDLEAPVRYGLKAIKLPGYV